VLYEIANEKHTAIFEFKLLEGTGDGFWLNKSTSKKLPLHLEMVSKIVDLNLNSEFSDVDVLQFQSLKDFYLVSSYSKVKGIDKAQLAKLKILRKKDNSVYQTIDLSNMEYQAGNLMTIIFDNVSVLNFNKKILGVSRQLGKNQDPLCIFYNVQTRIFNLEKSSK